MHSLFISLVHNIHFQRMELVLMNRKQLLFVNDICSTRVKANKNDKEKINLHVFLTINSDSIRSHGVGAVVSEYRLQFFQSNLEIKINWNRWNRSIQNCHSIIRKRITNKEEIIFVAFKVIFMLFYHRSTIKTSQNGTRPTNLETVTHVWSCWRDKPISVDATDCAMNHASL